MIQWYFLGNAVTWHLTHECFLILHIYLELAGLRTATIDSDPEDSDNASDDDDTNSDSGEEIISSAVSDTVKGKKNKGVWKYDF